MAQNRNMPFRGAGILIDPETAPENSTALLRNGLK
jgi:hypothetical protein